MNRKRIYITEVKITRAGQRKNFQIKLPKNVIRITGVATDIRIDGFSKTRAVPANESIALAANTNVITSVPAANSVGMITDSIAWNYSDEILAGRLRLQSLEKANVFYYEQLWLTPFDDGVTDEKEKMYAVSDVTMQQKREEKNVDVPGETTLINGIYQDFLGANSKQDIAYTVKIILWLETTEQSITKE